jgi:hypothetical protein
MGVASRTAISNSRMSWFPVQPDRRHGPVVGGRRGAGGRQVTPDPVERPLPGSRSEHDGRAPGTRVQPEQRNESHPPRSMDTDQAMALRAAPTPEQAKLRTAGGAAAPGGDRQHLGCREVRVRRVQEDLTHCDFPNDMQLACARCIPCVTFLYCQAYRRRRGPPSGELLAAAQKFLSTRLGLPLSLPARRGPGRPRRARRSARHARWRTPTPASSRSRPRTPACSCRSGRARSP